VRSAEGRSKNKNSSNDNCKNNSKGKSMAIYHLSAKVGSRSTGQSAAAKFAYICREGRYTEDRHDVDNRELVHAESGMMPEWADEAPARYWQSADLYERANGRLFQQVEFALPRELDREAQIELARKFADELSNTEHGFLPYTFAVHAGKGENPHAHIMLSERVHDGHDRTPETWFKRAAVGDKAPELGGAKKTNAFQGREWIDELRELWAVRANQALAREGHEDRIDHRSHADRGLQQIPTVHEGPNVRQMHARGLPGERMMLNQQVREANEELGRIDWLIDKTRAAMSAFNERARQAREALERVRESFNARLQKWQKGQAKQAQERKQETEREREGPSQHRGPRIVYRGRDGGGRGR
jgi:hypothetical protein